MTQLARGCGRTAYSTCAPDQLVKLAMCTWNDASNYSANTLQGFFGAPCAFCAPCAPCARCARCASCALCALCGLGTGAQEFVELTGAQWPEQQDIARTNAENALLDA